tara:strand:- start:169 stop:486 length:318 start_codon:yes stop_codon:yes gene_type:complete
MPHFNGKTKVCNRGGKVKKIDNATHYHHVETCANPDHPAMKRGKEFDVDKDIDRDKKIDPKKVFENYKEAPNKKNKKTKNEKKIRSMNKNPSINNARKATIHYQI